MDKVPGEAKRKPVRLGRGELNDPEFPAAVRVAWGLYMQAVEQVRPAAVEDLLAFPGLTAPDQHTFNAGTTAYTQAWANRWGFRVRYTATLALNTLERARDAALAGQPYPMAFATLIARFVDDNPIITIQLSDDGHPAVVGIPRDDETLAWDHPWGIHGDLFRPADSLNVELPAMCWNPLNERIEDAETRIMGEIAPLVRAALARVREELLAAGYLPVKEQRQPEHFVWLARNQLPPCERPEDIASGDLDGPDVRTIERGIAQAARALGMKLPMNTPGPKPGSRQRRH